MLTELIAISAEIEGQLVEQNQSGERMDSGWCLLSLLERVIAPPKPFEPIMGKNALVREMLRKANL